MQPNDKPGLFGITYSNRDFTQKESWGKNQFNNAFPASLACYMGVKGIAPVYLCVDTQGQFQQTTLPIEQLLGMKPLQPHLHFSFEQPYTPYADLVIGTLPGIDLVIQDTSTPYRDCLRGLEIKLTALPDYTTCELSEDQYGCEMVIRPDTIVYVGLSFAVCYRDKREQLLQLLAPICDSIDKWEDPDSVRPYLHLFVEVLQQIMKLQSHNQQPLLIQPVWKTTGKLGVLAEQCFDMFVWSDFGFTRMLTEQALNVQYSRITRIERSVVWLVKMLCDFARNGKIHHRQVIDQISFDTRNDKAFSLSGGNTHPYMKSQELTTPRVSKYAVKDIILGNGQRFLSPERRLDAIIVNSPYLFT
jgi:hypothetical protein